MRRTTKNKGVKTVVIVVTVLVLAVVFSIMLGNYLKEKAASTRPGDTETTAAPETTAPPTVIPPTLSHTVEAGYIDLKVDADEEKTAEKIAESFFLSSYTSASFLLRDADGSLLYTSRVATTLGQKSASPLDIKKLVELLSERDIYTVGCFDSAAFSADLEDGMYDVVISYESALIKELFEMGIDEILITSPTVSKESITDISKYLSDLRAVLPEGCAVGLCIPYSLFEDGDISAIAREVSLLTGLIAVDMRGFTGEDIYTATVDFAKSIEFYVTRYNMRMLLPNTSAADLTRQIDALGSNAIYNWQIIE